MCVLADALSASSGGSECCLCVFTCLSWRSVGRISHRDKWKRDEGTCADTFLPLNENASHSSNMLAWSDSFLFPVVNYKKGTVIVLAPCLQYQGTWTSLCAGMSQVGEKSWFCLPNYRIIGHLCQLSSQLFEDLIKHSLLWAARGVCLVGSA